MTRKLLVLLLPFVLFFIIPNANAQTATSGNNPITTRSAAIDSAAKLKLQMQLIQDQKKAAVVKAKEEIRAMVQTKREEFKTKLEAIRDQKKKALIERVDAKLAEVNKKYTSKFLEVLTGLQGFLDKIKQSTTNTTFQANVLIAQTAIDTAKTAVEAQAEKSYTMMITDETTLKLNAGAALSQLRQELMAVHKLVVDSKQAIQKLNTDKEFLKKEATSSAEL